LNDNLQLESHKPYGSAASSHMIAAASDADECWHLRRSAETHWLRAHVFAHSFD
jgi:hypothetical protein